MFFRPQAEIGWNESLSTEKRRQKKHRYWINQSISSNAIFDGGFGDRKVAGSNPGADIFFFS